MTLQSASNHIIAIQYNTKISLLRPRIQAMQGKETKGAVVFPQLELSVAAGAPVYWEEEELCLHEAIAAQARRTPEQTALEDGVRQPLTYAEMMHEAQCLARLLQHERGLSPGEVVGL